MNSATTALKCCSILRLYKLAVIRILNQFCFCTQVEHCRVRVQVCENALDSTGRRQGLCVLLLYGVGAAVPDEFQRRLLHSCPCKRPGGVRSAAVHLLAGTAGSGGATGGSERLSSLERYIRTNSVLLRYYKFYVYASSCMLDNTEVLISKFIIFLYVPAGYSPGESGRL